MPIAYTSRAGLASTLSDLNGLRREVYEAIAAWNPAVNGPSIEDLASKLGRKESSICGRLNELRELGAIQDGPLKINKISGNAAKTYAALYYRPEDNHPKPETNGQLRFL